MTQHSLTRTIERRKGDERLKTESDSTTATELKQDENHKSRNPVGYWVTYGLIWFVAVGLVWTQRDVSFREGAGTQTVDSLLVSMAVLILGAGSFFVLFLFAIVECSRSSVWGRVVKFSFPFITPPLLVLFWSAVPPLADAEAHTEGYLTRVEKHCDAEELRARANELIEWGLQHDKESGESVEIESTEEFIRMCPFVADQSLGEFDWDVRTKEGENYVSVFWGGSRFGLYGLEIGPESLDLPEMRQEPTRRDANVYIYPSQVVRLQWRPGIYVWYRAPA